MKLIALLLGVFILTACNSEKKDTAEPSALENFPDQESWETTIIITRDGERVGHVQAGHVRKYSKKGVTLLDEEIQVDFYDQNGRHTSVLTAEGGKVYDDNQDMLAYGNVIVRSDSGITLYTDTLIWDNKNQKVISEIPVKITTQENDILYGDSFISDPDLVNYEIVNPRGKTTKSIKID